MASFQKESGTAKGRGFGTVDGVPSFLNRLKTWIVKLPIAGGPGWFIIDDQSAAGSNPYIVISDVSAPTNANKGKIVRCIFPTSTGDALVFQFWEWWDVAAHSGYSNYSTFTMNTSEASEYEYNFRGGPDCLLLMTRIGSTWDWVALEGWTGISLLTEDPSLEGTLIANYAVSANDGSNQISELWRLTGIGPHLDANGKLYISIVVSGVNFGLTIYKDAARTLSIGTIGSASYTVGNLMTVSAANSSGVGGSIRLLAKTITDSDIEVDFKLYLGAGQGANLTANKYYFICDFVNGSNAAYIKVLSKSGDTIIADGLNGVQFNTGSVINPYGHRWFVWGNGSQAITGFTIGNGQAQLPYFSAFNANPSSGCISDGVASSFGNQSSVGLDVLTNTLRIMDPDDEGRYAVMKPMIYESADRSSSGFGAGSNNRAYGKPNNIYATSDVGISQMLDGRTIAGVDYICFFVSNNIAWLIRDTTSLS